MEKKVAIYILESDPDIQSQEKDLTQYAKDQGWLYKVFRDNGRGLPEEREVYRELIDQAYNEKCDIVLVWRLGDFVGGTQELIDKSAEFKAHGIDFVSYKEGIDTTMPGGELFFAITAALDEIEDVRKRRNIRRGMEYAQKHGTKSGKPVGRQPLEKEDIRTAIRLMDENRNRADSDGYTVKEIATRAGISVSSYYRVRNVCEDLEDNETIDETESLDEIQAEHHVSDRMFDVIVTAYKDYYRVRDI